jgi:membrane protein
VATIPAVARYLLWPPDLDRRPAPVRAAYGLGQFVFALARDLFTGQLTLRAMSLVYITLLSAVPLLAFSFSLIKVFGVHNALKPWLYGLLQPLGAPGIAITDAVIHAVDNVEGGVLGSVALLFFIYSAVAMVQEVEGSFNHVWHVGRPRSLVRRLTEYITVLLLGPVMVTVVVGLIASVAGGPFVRRLAAVEPFGTLLHLGGTALPWVVVVAVFTFLYEYLPNAPVRLRAALAGGLVAGLAWSLLGRVFASVVAFSAARDAIYGTFAVSISALIWLYLSWLLLLLGAQLAFYVQHPAALRLGRQEPRVSNGLRERMALNVMYLVGESFRRGGPPCTTGSIAAATRLPGLLLGRTIAELEAAGLISATQEEALVPGRDLARITLGEILAAVRAGEEPGELAQPAWSGPVAEVMDGVDAAIAARTRDITLATLLDRAPAG